MQLTHWKPWDKRATVLWEGAIASLVMLLYSPITWGQHCVAALPAIYVLCRCITSGRAHTRGFKLFLGVLALLYLGTNRTFLGNDVATLFESYHVVTISFIALVPALIVCRGQATTGANSSAQAPAMVGPAIPADGQPSARAA